MTALMDEQRYATGDRIRRQVMGDAHVDRGSAQADDFSAIFHELATEYCWGVVWGQEVLDRKQRSLNNLCLLAALNRPREFEAHVRGALVNGCTRDEIRETLVQITVYAGIPAGNEAFRIAGRVLQETAGG